MQRPTVLIVGHSHTYALQAALRKDSARWQGVDFKAYQFAREKNGRRFGDITVEDMMALIRDLKPADLLVSCIGGNQHSVVGLVQHPIPFDILESGQSESALNANAVCIPSNMMRAYLAYAIRKSNGHLFQRLRTETEARVFHVCAPPPKEDVQHILSRHESKFALAGILEKGVSPAPLRAKLWRLQVHVLQALCAEWGITFLPPPDGTVTLEGFLKRDYYSDDATHANERYGALVLENLIHLTQKAATP